MTPHDPPDHIELSRMLHEWGLLKLEELRRADGRVAEEDWVRFVADMATMAAKLLGCFEPHR